MNLKPLRLVFCVPLILLSLPVGSQSRLPLDTIKLPPGFSITVYADNVPNARSMTLGARGTVFVGSMAAGKVYAVVDKDGDQRGDEIHTIAQGLNHPNGTAFKDGSLYVAEINRILRFDKIEENLADPPSQSSSTIAYPMTFITAGSSSPSAPTACSTSLSGRPATSASQIPISTPS